ncbi:hypothetical protein [Legionella pneumophila]|uniref:hypothetical protein n=1 Tax=Legionella pneumophila TaxID=446 RepID=UPI001374D75D|nr:hypothetical protein [Legionella pneumophila]HAT2149246.1 hypothetical protein [Legionella pneumophila]HAT8729388.1 hypothetical protein [Legionella pneumophila]
MDIKKLKKAASNFLERYPDGFYHPEIIEMGKKHKMDKMVALAQGSFAKKNFKNPDEITNSMLKIVTQSSLISIFEKPKFRDFIKRTPPNDKVLIAKGLKELLYGNEQEGFEELLFQFQREKLAKWTLMTIFQAYFNPEVDVFIKPTTTKNIIKKLNLDIVYNPTPSWEFYESYRNIINQMKTKIEKSLAPSNAAFCGFLMMSLDNR